MVIMQTFRKFRYFSICTLGCLLMIAPVIIVVNLWVLRIVIDQYRLTTLERVLWSPQFPLLILMWVLFVGGFAITLVGYAAWRRSVVESKRTDEPR